MLARSLALSLAALVAFACGAPAAAPASTAAAPTPTAAPAAATPTPVAAATPMPVAAAPPTSVAAATPTPAPASEPGAVIFQVQIGAKAIVRVREQLAGVSAPGDAVLETSDVKGSFGLRAGGAFTADSKITVGLQALRSDSDRRDGFIKNETLDTRRFPTADFVPTRAVGLPSPLPASGEWTFQVVGKMTIKGVEKEVTWDVKAKRDGTGITASAKNAPVWKFGDFGMQAPRVFTVLSINDEIRLELELVARESR